MKEVLVQNLAARMVACHLDETRRSVDADSNMPEGAEVAKIPPRPSAEVENERGRRCIEVSQEGLIVLRDVVVTRPLEERFGRLVVVRDRACTDTGEPPVVSAHEPSFQRRLCHVVLPRLYRGGK